MDTTLPATLTRLRADLSAVSRDSDGDVQDVGAHLDSLILFGGWPKLACLPTALLPLSSNVTRAPVFACSVGRSRGPTQLYQ